VDLRQRLDWLEVCENALDVQLSGSLVVGSRRGGCPGWEMVGRAFPRLAVEPVQRVVRAAGEGWKEPGDAFKRPFCVVGAVDALGVVVAHELVAERDDERLRVAGEAEPV